MIKLIVQIAMQTILFTVVSVYLLFRNDGEGAKWLITEIPIAEKKITECISGYIPALTRQWDTILHLETPLQIFNSSNGQNGHSKSTMTNGGIDSEIVNSNQNDPAKSEEQIKINVNAITKIYTAMEQVSIQPKEGVVTVWIPVKFNLPGEEKRGFFNLDRVYGSQDRDIQGSAETYLLNTYKRVTNQDCTEAPTIRTEGRRLYGRLRGENNGGNPVELTLQMEGQQGHLTVTIRQDLPEISGISAFESLNKLAEGNQKFEYSITLLGSRPGHLSPQEQEVAISSCFDRIQAERLRVSVDDVMIVSAYWSQLPSGIKMGERDINLQALVRYHGVDQRTYFAIGYPLVMQEM
ncbi:hypothetical protein GJ688_11420 [Heliobacillus mobilis]|uniref:TATA-box binding protein n=1 Tax=Heliobacterium mobile TaxID=28064 RepID=A0A6I3SLD2_HELMO|nr:YwmB family TATA-box binding protein [Heliobacterium mobile]MTV49586.1 hypothetical protein [Heliobacterium mobile]